MSNKLLLADDSITIQKVVGIIFANEDYELTVVDNGDAALEKAKQIIPDIILVDALMPGKNGYEVCAGVRRDPKLNTIPLLLMTGAFEPFDEDKARQSGADDFISKPFESQQLIDRVKKLIELGKERVSVPAAGPSVAIAASPEPVFPSAVAMQTAAPVANELAQAFAEEPVIEEKAEEIFALGEEAIEGSADDDLWGAFEIEDLSAGGAAEFGVVEEKVPAVAIPAPVEVDEEFSFADVNDDIGGAVAASTQAEVQQFETGWEPVEEQTFAFQEEEHGEVGQPVELGVAAEPSEFEFAPEAEEPAPETVFSSDENAETVVDLSSTVSPQPAKAPVAPVAIPDAGVSAAPAADGSQLPVITEAQLVAALRTLSREVIEKIVWEVVPDLAELLIKEEIRKLKGGSGS
ncbi:response regulator [Geotalea toluenoxydans]|uniref:response regulator n=1 Tax=Geotalea toluenoxydans TaxID=421624 RepID=UPI0006D1AA0D|nr:response regulator [Geotalea toluenoxydans]